MTGYLANYSKPMFGHIINDKAVKYNLPPAIVAAIVLQESRGNTFATRYEPAFFDRYVKDKRRQDLAGWVPEVNHLPSLWTEKVGRATSWGLMQCMGDTSRWCYGLRPKDENDPLDPARYFAALCDPVIGIECGCHILDFYLDKEKVGTPEQRMIRGLSRYNSGSPTSTAGVQYAHKILDHVTTRTFLEVM